MPARVAQKLRAQAELLAEADVPVLIFGETGSGKDTVARLIHKLSVRSGFQFLKVNCADMPADLLENELFGNERSVVNGGRTGLGKIERAEKGTIFLDEITEMPMALQARVMQILQDKVLLRPSSDKTAPPSMFVSWRRPAPTSIRHSRKENCGKICTIGSAPSRFKCRHCDSAGVRSQFCCSTRCTRWRGTTAFHLGSSLRT